MNFQIETTSFCDLTCTECSNRFMTRKRQFMSRQVWDTIIRDYVIPYRRLNDHLGPPTLIPHKDGEPLLNKNLPTLLGVFSKELPDMKIDIYTHGLLLTPAFLAFLGSLPNPVRLMISFHFYNHDGTKNDYDRTEALLREWLSRPKLGPENIEYILASHLVKPMTRESLEEWKATWQSFIDSGRLTVHANVNVSPWAGYTKEHATVQYHYCPYFHFDHVFFGATGNIIACCMDLEEEIVFGNVLKDDPAVMVETLREFYARQEVKDFRHDVCYRCLGMEVPAKLVQLGVPV